MVTFPLLKRIVAGRDGRRLQQHNNCPVAPHFDAFGAGLPRRSDGSSDVGL
jgi:hypothetical protein